jgi:predicted type IV restriction endonuclease
MTTIAVLGTIRVDAPYPCRVWRLRELLFSMSPTVSPGDQNSSIAAALRQIAERIPRLRAQGSRVSEQDTKRILITPTVAALGWDTYDIDEVRNEYRHNTADNPVDYALFLNRSPVLFVEAKPLGHSLDDRKWVVQTINYANAAGVDWCVLTNGSEWRIYKVHAQVEADRKLFAAVAIDRPETINEAARVLCLLTRENMRARAIDELWQAWHVDTQVQTAVEQTLQEDSFAKLLGKRLPQLALADIRKSLRRARISISYPNIFGDGPSTPASTTGTPELVVSPAPPVAPLISTEGAPSEMPAGGPHSKGSRRRLQSTEDLVHLGRLPIGTTLTIRGRENSAAQVLDGRHVEFRGERMTFNEWGQRVTGWSAIQIYAWACLPDGRTLGDLRLPEPGGG